MARNVFVKDQVRDALVAAAFACAQITDHSSATDPQSYSQGFRAALVMLALSFGITLPLEDANFQARQQRFFQVVNQADNLIGG